MSQEVSESYRYDAFISYRHVEPDRRWAKWLHSALETYRVPKWLVRERGIAPKLSRVFRDEEEVPASADLGKEIETALQASRFLIVVCSPRTPESAWVNREIERFREMGRGDQVLALLIEGEPKDAFPQALRQIRRAAVTSDATTQESVEEVEPLAADVRVRRGEGARHLRRAAKLRLLACVVGCRYDDLMRRDERRRRRRWTAGVAALAVLVLGGLLGLRVRERGLAMDVAAVARAESGDALRRYESLRQEIVTLGAVVEEQRTRVFNAFSPIDARAAFAKEERTLEEKRAEAERLTQQGREALERAARAEAPWDGMTAETRAAFASYYMGRWWEAVASSDEVRARLAREQVEQYDQGVYATELEGRGTLTVDVDPPDAEVYLFRYESYETVRTDPPVIPRLVPVPTSGIGRVRPGEWVPDFYPGDPCLVVTKAPEKGSPADGVLEPGDLVIRLNGLPCGDGLFVTEVMPEGLAAKAGVRPFDRIESIDGNRVEVRQDWTQVKPDKEVGGAPHKVRLRRGGHWIDLEGPHEQTLANALGMPLGAEVVPLLQKTPAPEGGYRLTCLHRGGLVTLDVPAGGTSGLTLDRTAYPLILGPDLPHRVRAGAALGCAPGSYLLHVRAPGREDQRYPVAVPRGKAKPATARLRLLPAGKSPEGFTYVPPGVFVYGGDPEAYQSAPRQLIDVAQDAELKDGFWIARREITFAEWLEFLNDPETRADLKPGRTDLLPRYNGDAFVRKGDDGLYAQTLGEPATAVLGISWNDLKAPRGYLAWKNRKAEHDGTPWRYDLPSEQEWECAARGADGRALPWGRRFDFGLCVSSHMKSYQTHILDPGADPTDESPFGVRDLGGGRYEWCRNAFAPGSRIYPLRGGAWGDSDPSSFRSAARVDYEPSGVSPRSGGRLVVHQRP